MNYSNFSVNNTVWVHHMDANKTHREKARCELHEKCYEVF